LFSDKEGVRLNNNDPIYYNPPVKDFDERMNFESEFALPDKMSVLPVENAE